MIGLGVAHHLTCSNDAQLLDLDEAARRAGAEAARLARQGGRLPAEGQVEGHRLCCGYDGIGQRISDEIHV